MLDVLPSKFFKFKETRYWAGSRPLVGFAAKYLVKSLIDTDELSELFGGYLEYENEAGDQRYLGVWGDRKVARFLRLLRDRGALVEVEETLPTHFRQRHRASR